MKKKSPSEDEFTTAYYTELMRLTSRYMPTARFRAFLDYVEPKCYVESISTDQGGTVKDVLRNRFGIPVCLMVESGDGVVDFIPVDRVSMFEPYSDYAISESIYEDDSDIIEMLKGRGYQWNEEEQAYIDPVSGDSYQTWWKCL